MVRLTFFIVIMSFSLPVISSLEPAYPSSLVDSIDIIPVVQEDSLAQGNTASDIFPYQIPGQDFLDWHKEFMEKMKAEEKVRSEKVLALFKRILSDYGNNKEYTVILISSCPQSDDGEVTYIENLHKLLEQRNLMSQINVLLIYPHETDSGIKTIQKGGMEKDYIYYLPENEIEHRFNSTQNHYYVDLLKKGEKLIMRLMTTKFPPEEELLNQIESAIAREKSDLMKGFYKGLFITLSVAFAILLFMKTYGHMKLRKERRQRQIKELELKAIRTQMNPHFIFNALSSIQNLLGKGCNEKANDYLVRFSRLLRTVLKNSEKKLVSLSGEIEQICLYLDLEQLRFPFVYSIEVDNDLETDLIEIPGMMIQPFVENAVKHAVAPRGEGEITIIMKQKGNILNVYIVDDGPGFSSSNSEGFGIKAVTEEIEILKNLYHSDIQIIIENRQEKESCTGLKVSLSIPIG